MPWLIRLIVGWAAVVLTAIQFIPQVIKSLKTRKLRDVSLGTFLLIIVTAFTWLIYGIYESDIVIIAANALVLLSALIITTLKLKYKH